MLNSLELQSSWNKPTTDSEWFSCVLTTTTISPTYWTNERSITEHLYLRTMNYASEKKRDRNGWPRTRARRQARINGDTIWKKRLPGRGRSRGHMPRGEERRRRGSSSRWRRRSSRRREEHTRRARHSCFPPPPLSPPLFLWTREAVVFHL